MSSSKRVSSPGPNVARDRRRALSEGATLASRHLSGSRPRRADDAPFGLEGPSASRSVRPGGAPPAEAHPGEYHSILFPGPPPAPAADPDPAPAFFRDLPLDQVVEAVTGRRQEYDLVGFFLRPVRDIAILEYRHDVMRELQRGTVLERIRAFAAELRAMRNQSATAEKLSYKEQKEAWLVDAVEIYCRAVARLAENLDGVRLSSSGFAAFRQYLCRYVASDQFAALRADTAKLKEALSEVRRSSSSPTCTTLRTGSTSARGRTPCSSGRTGKRTASARSSWSKASLCAPASGKICTRGYSAGELRNRPSQAPGELRSRWQVSLSDCTEKPSLAAAIWLIAQGACPSCQ